jgi:hypothetical protein
MKETTPVGPLAEIVSIQAAPSGQSLGRRELAHSSTVGPNYLSVSSRRSTRATWDYAQGPAVRFEFFIVSGGERRLVCTVSFPPGS